MTKQFRCIIHGSFSKYFDDISEAIQQFNAAGIEVLAPKQSELVASKDGFALFKDEIGRDPRLIELIYLSNLKKLGDFGFSYFVNTRGYVGVSTSYELAVAQITNTPCYFSSKIIGHPAYTPGHTIWSVRDLIDYIKTYSALPTPQIHKKDRMIHQLFENLMVPGSIIATGAVIEHQPSNSKKDKEILLVKTHKWSGCYSIVGGSVKRKERLQDAPLREVKEETNLSGDAGRHICTFDQIQDLNYYKSGVQHVFVDNVVKVQSKKVILNHEAEDYVWALPSEALRYLDIEPNARITIEQYLRSQNSAMA